MLRETKVKIAEGATFVTGVGVAVLMAALRNDFHGPTLKNVALGIAFIGGAVAEGAVVSRAFDLFRLHRTNN